MPSPLLKTLEKNKYISDEERRFNRQQKTAWAAIVVSFLIGFCGIYYNHQNCKDQERQRNLQIQENRRIADSIIKKIDTIQASSFDYRPVIKEVSRELAKTRKSGTTAPNHE